MIRGKVARIMSDKKIALNVGEKDGVAAGMKFVIFAPRDEIVDPETGESLGGFRTRKATVRVTMVSERFCFAGPVARSRLLSTLFNAGVGEIESVESPLPIDQSQVEPIASGSSIRLGDVAEQLESPAQSDKEATTAKNSKEDPKPEDPGDASGDS